MAEAAELITQLAAILPAITSYFSDEFEVESLTQTGGIATVVTAAAHGLLTGQIVTISGAIAPVEIISLTSVGTVASGEVNNTTPHDLTLDITPYYQPVVNMITGVDQAAYNGIGFRLLAVPNRFQFSYQLPEEATSPATGETMLLFDGKERGYNGNFIITVVNATTFTYAIAGGQDPYSPPLGIPICRANVRISGSESAERAIDAYTKENRNKLWGFLVLGDTEINKDRLAFNNDARNNLNKNADVMVMEIQTASFYVITPSVDEIAARAARDLMERIRVFLYKALLLFKPSSGLVDQTAFGIAPSGHRKFVYNSAFYVHEFNFEIINYIRYNDCIAPDINVAFRDVYLALLNDPGTEITLGVNLDVDPFEG
jgi:hypothetical protein